MIKEEDNSPQHLYRHYNKEGVLLYVGISLSAINRLGQHKDHAHWFSLISRVEIESFSSRAEVRNAEIAAINKENPLYNLQRPTLKEQKTIYQDAKDDLVKRIVTFNITYSIDDLVNILGLRKSQILKEIEKGLLSCVELPGLATSTLLRVKPPNDLLSLNSLIILKAKPSSERL